ncbi:MAG: dusC [Chlamydiales bacterium]|jgi:tRNA-dihydrouridine synthase C|nr:dusC [Chlamydiales bacterium]
MKIHSNKEYYKQIVWITESGCPRLFMAPMEGVGDQFFRAAISAVGGMDEICTEFFRVPTNAHVVSLASKYHADELKGRDLAVQIMGQDPTLMADMAYHLWQRGAPRIELNCGCPSNIVVGRGAGSSLLKSPSLLNQIATAIVKAVGCPVSLKMRTGYNDTSLFRENIFAAQESGIAFLTIHARTRAQRYEGQANWDYIAEAKQLLSIPIIGNGDVVKAEDVKRLLQHTQCDGVMIGRGAVMSPWLFHEIRLYFSNQPFENHWYYLEQFLNVYSLQLSNCPYSTQINKWKQMINYLFQLHSTLQDERHQLLRFPFKNPQELFEKLFSILKKYYKSA